MDRQVTAGHGGSAQLTPEWLVPFHLVHFALAGGFVAVWAFIVITMLRDRLGEARAERLAEEAPTGPAPRGHAPQRARRRRRRELARV